MTLLAGSVGGKALSSQPVLEIIDAGGNRLVEDSTSKITVSIQVNSGNAILSPVDALTISVEQGVGTFRNLELDKIGQDYTLLFTHLTKRNGVQMWDKSSLEKESDAFNVVLGEPTHLILQTSAAGAANNGQPFLQQPQVTVTDAGANVITTENSAAVLASFTESLSRSSDIVIDTTSSPATTVATVVATLPALTSSPFGVGQVIDIVVTFSAEVTATGDPSLLLETGSKAICLNTNVRGLELIFRYTVQAGDTTADLAYVSTTSLDLESGSILDGSGNVVTLTLPTVGGAGSLSYSSAIAINTATPVLQSITSTFPGNGIFGLGQEISFIVTYDFPITVTGYPTLEVILSGSTNRLATYVSGSDTTALVFDYVVESTDMGSLDISSDIDLNDGSMLRTSTTPTTAALLAVGGNTLSSSNTMSIDTTAVTIDDTTGITCLQSDAIYAPGDILTITVPFTQAVVVTGVPYLYLETGSSNQAAVYTSGSSTSTLTFTYTVRSGYAHTGSNYLNYRDNDALELNGGTILRYVTKGTAAGVVDVSLAATTTATKALSDNNNVQVDGDDVTVSSVSFATGDSTVDRGDTVDLAISFSAAVDVDTSDGTPTILLDTGTTLQSGVYYSGSGTMSLTMRYTVALGDVSAKLDYTSIYALVLNGASIRRDSTDPTLNAILTLPAVGTITGSIVVDPAVGDLTTVLSLTTSTSVGSYGLNHVVELILTFSDVVVVVNYSGLVLGVNTGTDAVYIGGSGTTALTFAYTVLEGDAVASLDVATTTSLVCIGSCSLLNDNAVSVDLSLSGISLAPSNIALSTVPPTVLSLAATTVASVINGNAFVIGDEIDIAVTMSDEVFVFPLPETDPDKVPCLLLETGTVDRCALFISYGSANTDRTVLLFRYTVQEGDTSSNLAYESVDALNLNYDQATIRRFSTTPTTDAVLTLPNPVPLGTSLVVDTSQVPSVVSVTSTTSDDTYFTNDVIVLEVTFTSEVSVTGVPYLWLDLGGDAKALYTSGDGTTILVFEYTITEEVVSFKLEYVDRNSLVVPKDATLKQYSDTPTVLVDLLLPFPAASGSLSAAHLIEIDGRTPYIVSVSSVTADGSYGIGQSISVQLTFSSTVVVDTSSGTPSLLLETGDVHRQALYVSGSPGTVLTFDYIVVTGDVSADLDYSAPTSLQLNGGTIRTKLTGAGTPSQDADLVLNPPGGALLGTFSVLFDAGVAVFRDLVLQKLGYEYRIVYSSTLGGGIFTSGKLDVVYSTEYELRPDGLESGSALGSSVAISGTSLVMGAPGVRKVNYEVQTITTTGSATVLRNEIQVLKTSGDHQNEIQQITSTASSGEIVGGYFTAMYGSLGPSRRIRHDSSPGQLKVALELDFGWKSNTLEIIREDNTFCDCQLAYTWTVTFIKLQGDVETLTFTSSLTGSGASIGDGQGGNVAVVITDTLPLSGTFNLGYDTLTTSDLNFDIDAITLRTRISTDLSLPVSQYVVCITRYYFIILILNSG